VHCEQCPLRQQEQQRAEEEIEVRSYKSMGDEEEEGGMGEEEQ
jgi:hypothetical protein